MSSNSEQAVAEAVPSSNLVKVRIRFSLAKIFTFNVGFNQNRQLPDENLY